MGQCPIQRHIRSVKLSEGLLVGQGEYLEDGPKFGLHILIRLVRVIVQNGATNEFSRGYLFGNRFLFDGLLFR